MYIAVHVVEYQIHMFYLIIVCFLAAARSERVRVWSGLRGWWPRGPHEPQSQTPVEPEFKLHWFQPSCHYFVGTPAQLSRLILSLSVPILDPGETYINPGCDRPG